MAHEDGASPILARLNPEQQEAVLCTDGPLLVLAGAGSGKTRVITHRIAWLVENGAHPEAILGVTFTNKAAREMRERVVALTGYGGPRVQTFHAFCAAFLRVEFPSVGRSGAFTIYDTDDAAALVRTLLKELALDEEFHKPKELVGRISAWKNRDIGPDEAAEAARRNVDEEAARIYALYCSRMAEASACDFDDLLLETRRILREQEDVRTRWQRRLSHVLVDEFQDTNLIQYELVRHLTAASGNLCVTGDQDQSIYSWRGARPENFDDFLRDHKNARIVKLERNYRSTGNILGAARTLIAHNIRRIPKSLWTKEGPGVPVRVEAWDNDVAEAMAVAGAIGGLLDAGSSRSENAVLFRTNALSLPVERALLQAGIPYVVIGGLEFFARQEVKDLLAYMKFLANPADVVSMLRIINVPARGIGQQTRDEVTRRAAATGQKAGSLLRDANAFEDLPSRAKNALLKFREVLLRLDEVAELRPSRILEEILQATGYDTYWVDKATKGGSVDPHQNIGQLVRVAKDFEATKDGRLDEFLAEIALLTDLDRLADEKGAVALLTMHSAKGLEFDNVFVIGVDQSICPHAMSTLGEDGAEEERRLLHVAMTRARHRLVLTCARSRSRFGSFTNTGPSPFLDEIGEDGVERFDASARAGSDSWGGKAADYEPEPDMDDDLRFAPGARVWHPQWGSGRVRAVRGRSRGLDQKLVVEFEGGCERVLVLRHSGLSPRED